MRYELKESDWRYFCEHLEAWRERYLDSVNRHVVEILSVEKETPAKRFWSAKRCMDREAKILENCLDNCSRSRLLMKIQMMYHHGMIAEADIAHFSEELQEWHRALLQS
jgi:hypothetical protein